MKAIKAIFAVLICLVIVAAVRPAEQLTAKRDVSNIPLTLPAYFEGDLEEDGSDYWISGTVDHHCTFTSGTAAQRCRIISKAARPTNARLESTCVVRRYTDTTFSNF